MSSVRRGIQPWLLAGASALYFAWMGGLARLKPLWFDEVITLYLARLPGPALWEAIRHGADNHPPLYHLAASAATAWLGEGAFALRLPAMLGSWVLGIALFRFVGRRCGPPYAWAALAFPLSTAASAYAYEARPYGLVLGGCGLALVGWQAAAGGGRRRPGLVGLALGLAIAAASHFYSVLIFLPLALGECARGLRRGAVDWPVWLAFAAGATPLPFLVPLLEGLEPYRAGFWARPDALSIPRAYAFLLGPALPFLVPLGVASLRPGGPEAGPGAAADLPRHEVVAALAFAAFPIFTYALAVLVTGAFTGRYCLPAVAGFGILVPFLAYRLGRGRPRAGWALAAITMLGGVGGQAWDLWTLPDRFSAPAGFDRPFVVAARYPLPVVMWDPLMYLPLTRDLPARDAARLVGVLERPLSTADLVLRSLSPYAPLRVVAFRRFVADRRGAPFLLLSRPSQWRDVGWIVHGGRMTLLYQDPRWILAHVAPPAGPVPGGRGSGGEMVRP